MSTLPKTKKNLTPVKKTVPSNQRSTQLLKSELIKSPVEPKASPQYNESKSTAKIIGPESGSFVNNTFNKDKENRNEISDIGNCDIREIDALIRKQSEAKKVYSKTYAESYYVPLTMNDKMKFIEDLNHNADKRLNLYSELFKEIRSQISILSNNISPQVESIKAPQKIPGDKFLLEISKEESKKLSTINEKPIKKIELPGKVHTFVKRRSKSFLDFDWRDSDENIGSIRIPTKAYNSNVMQNLNNFAGRTSKSICPSLSHRNKDNEHTRQVIQLMG